MYALDNHTSEDRSIVYLQLSDLSVCCIFLDKMNNCNQLGFYIIIINENKIFLKDYWDFTTPDITIHCK